MLDKPDNRGELVKGVLAGGLVLIGLATGNGPLFTLLISTAVSVGGNLLANIADKSFDNWRKRWFSPDGVFNDHIKGALSQAFADAVHQLEIEWQKNNDYHYLIYKKEYERAKLSLILLRELQTDSNKIFQGENNLSLALDQESLSNLIKEDEFEESVALKFLDQTLDEYLGTVEQLAEFAKTHLANKWLFRFSEILKTEKGTPAWRGYQQLWQHSLLQSITELHKSIFQTQDDIAQVQQDLEKVAIWLEDWSKQLESHADAKNNLNISKAFSDIIDQHFQVYNEKLDTLTANTTLIINLLKDKFVHLDFDKVMINFLQKELLNDQYVNLKQAGHNSEEEDVSLGRVFVDLPVSDERSIDPPEEESSGEGLPPSIVAQILSSANEHLDPETLSLQSDQSQAEQLSLPSKYKRGRFVVIGGPGQGKTTLSQFICQLFRASILDKRPEVYYERVRGTLSEIKTLCSQEKFELPLIPRIPFRIILSDFAATLASNQSINSLLSYIVDRIRTRTDQEITTDHLRQWLAGYPWVIILDGLDEVPASSNRDAVLSAIDNFWIDATGHNADVLVIATTRPQGFNDDFAPNLYQHKWLVPLSEKRAMHYANRLVNVRYRQDHDRQRKIIERLQSALRDEATARLMRSPLQVTIMTALVDRIGKPPQERWSLFQRYYSVIYHRETERDIPAASILRNYEPDINAIHFRVGLVLQIESEFSGRTGVRLSHDRFASLVEARLAEEGHDGKELEELKRRIIEAATDRLVFLVGVEANEIGFEIRSLQEFMAAEALMGASDDLIQKRLRQIAPVINWRNVFLFAAGKCFAIEDRQHLRETIRGICAELNESTKLEDAVFHATLAGSQLALDLLEDGPAQRQPKFAKSLARLASRLWNMPPSKNHLRLANLYENQFEDVYIQELEARLGDARIRQGPWRSLIYLSNKQIQWAERLVEDYWPSSEAELLDLLKSAIEGEITSWPIEKFTDSFSRIPPYDLFRMLQKSRQLIADHQKFPDQLHWLNSLLSLPKPTAIPLRLPNIEKINDAFRIHIIRNYPGEWTKSIAEISNPTNDWLPFILAARFVESPNKTILASALRNIAEHCSIESIKWAADLIPWMLGTILDTVESKEELNLIANHVEIGEFGDTEIWNTAETRWLADGIVETDLEYMTDEHWPFDTNIGRVGIPLSCLRRAAFTKSLPTGAVTLISSQKNLFDLVRKYGGTKSGSQLATSIAWSIMFEKYFAREGLFFPSYKEQEEKSDLINFNYFQELVKEANKDLSILIDSLPHFDWENLNNEEYFDFMDYLGRERHCYAIRSRFALVQKSDKEYANSLVQPFVDNSTRLGILNVLSELATAGHHFSVPEYLLQPEKYPERRSQKAVLIIRLTQPGWNQAEGSTLARYTLEFAKAEAEIIDRSLETISTNRIVGLPIEAYLLELLNATASSDWSSKMKILDALENSLRHRTSHLLERWEELGLPISLKSLITLNEVAL